VGCFAFRLGRPVRCEFFHMGGEHIEVLQWRNRVRD
jgi:hypothetical protein